MRVGGNDQCNQFLQKYGVPKTMPIPQKYNTPAAMLYKDRIDAAANGRPLPTELPGGSAMGGGGSTHSSNNSLHSTLVLKYPHLFNVLLIHSRIVSFSYSVAQGTDPLAGESEADYVARQRQLQEEVAKTTLDILV